MSSPGTACSPTMRVASNQLPPENARGWRSLISIRARRWLRPGAMLAAMACLAACTATAPGPAAAAPAGRAGAPAPAPAWKACGAGLECSTLSVPVDHSRLDGPRTTLAVLRHRATEPSRRIGVLLVNPGGPGASGVDFVRAAVAAPAPGVAPYFGAEVRARYDIVGMDPRGVGGSREISCQTDPERERSLARDLDARLPGGLAVPTLARHAAELGRACLARNDRTFLAHVATDDVARDLDFVRSSLQEDQVSYMGVSYGTLLGVTYAQLFPERVRRIVLDAPVHPTRWQSDPVGVIEDQAISAEQQLQLYFRTCLSQGAACGFGGGRPGPAFDALVRKLEARPLTVPAVAPLPAVRIDGASLLLAARTAVIRAQWWPALTAALIGAQRGDGRGTNALVSLLTRDRDGTPSALTEANLAVNCLDKVRPGRRDFDDQVRRLAARAPRFATISSYALLGCTSWPVDNPNRYTGPYTGHGAPPALVVGGRLDSQTPFSWARAMTETVVGSVLLTRDGVGHGSYGSRLNSPCIDDAVDTYLTEGTLPAAGTVCSAPPLSTEAVPG